MIDCNKCPKEKERFQYGIDEDPFFIRAHQLKLCFTCALDHLIESEGQIADLKKQKQIAYDELNNICKCGMCNEALDAIQRALFILEEEDDD